MGSIFNPQPQLAPPNCFLQLILVDRLAVATQIKETSLKHIRLILKLRGCAKPV